MDADFKLKMEEMGIILYSEQFNVWKIANHCVATSGKPLALATGIVGAAVGGISGAAVGALAGLVTGTLGCAMLNYAVKDEIKKLSKGQ